ncbi:hypothetical protein [Spirosoma aerolatum]|uniref:hypothetical protein n=1 Tax=Spirosoma aerolatum TaxID=1211326 RepID=UPI0012D2E1E9|nr:hypothetical protein [Spirosoma aerolatum]
MQNIVAFCNLIIPAAPEYNQQDGTIEFVADQPELIVETLQDLQIKQVDSIGKNIQILLDQNDLIIFFNENDFFDRIAPNNFECDLLIIYTSKGVPYFFDHTSGETYINFSFEERDYLFSNVQIYFNYIQFLRTQDHQEDKPFYFVDHFNDTSDQIIFTSSKKEGKLSIPFGKTRPDFNRDKSLKSTFEQFKLAFDDQNRHLPKFIKYELFNFLPKIDRDERMKAFIEKMPEMLHNAQQNFEIYLNDLSLDKLKSEYRDSQEQYFTKLRELLGKVINQTIAFPLSITVTAFATFKVTDSSQPLTTVFLLLLIVAAFLVFTFYTTFLLGIQQDDVRELKSNFEDDFAKLARNKFFEKESNIEDSKHFKEAKQKVLKQFSKFNLAVKIYFIIQVFFNTLFICFILFQVGMSIKWLVPLGILLVTALYFVFNYYITHNTK